MGGDQWNGIAVRIAQAAVLGQADHCRRDGSRRRNPPGCMTLAARSTEIQDQNQSPDGGGHQRRPHLGLASRSEQPLYDRHVPR